MIDRGNVKLKEKGKYDLVIAHFVRKQNRL